MDTFVLVRGGTVLVTFAAFTHNAVLSVMHVLWRQRINWLEFCILQACNMLALGVLWQLCMWHKMPKARRYFSSLILSSGYLFAMFANVAVNATPGRSSSMALLDAGDNLNPKPKP
eukprot:Tamp_26670.p1 GENE.Tamp_26670~~Tamp_26670.p1  ORF type:complete len:116 (+),score=14.40 Tamp_26670:272-619(+)